MLYLFYVLRRGGGREVKKFACMHECASEEPNCSNSEGTAFLVERAFIFIYFVRVSYEPLGRFFFLGNISSTISLLLVLFPCLLYSCYLFVHTTFVTLTRESLLRNRRRLLLPLPPPRSRRALFAPSSLCTVL